MQQHASSARVVYSVLAAGIAVMSVGCAAGGGAPGLRSPAEYRETFTHVLAKTLGGSSRNNVCLPPLFGFAEHVEDSVDVNADIEPVGPVGRLAQLRALEAAGLVSHADSPQTINGKAQHEVRYRRTEKGVAASAGPAFCYARAELDHVVKWKGPVVLGAYQAAWVYYTVKITHVDDWARAPAILAAFPTVGPILSSDPPKVRQAALDLSSEGWDIAEYSKLLQLQ